MKAFTCGNSLEILALLKHSRQPEQESFIFRTLSPVLVVQLNYSSFRVGFICTLALLEFPRSQDGAPALALVGQRAGPRHEGQIAVLVGRVPQIGQALEACAPQEAGFPVREGVKAVAAVVGAHPAGTCQEGSVRLELLSFLYPHFYHRRTDAPKRQSHHQALQDAVIGAEASTGGLVH